MRKSQKEIYIIKIILIIFAIGIICLAGVHTYSIYKLNNIDFVMDEVTEKLDKSTVDRTCFTIYPRGGNSGSWVKRDFEFEGVPDTLVGTIYDIEIFNMEEFNISDWQIRFDVKEKCYINTAWCGTIEIHQNVNTNEMVQELDLRVCNQDEIQLNNYKMEDGYLIPLEVGDYFIYHPSVKDKESVIQKANGYPTNLIVGVIVYSEHDIFEQLERKFTYSYNISFFEGKRFALIVLLCFVWIILTVICITIGVFSEFMQKQIDSRTRILEEALSVFTHFVDAKDPNTHGHSLRVADYSRKLAEKMGFDEEKCSQIYHSALLHDCGKCYIDDAVLKKPDRLNAEEYEIIKIHTTKGAQMLENFTSVHDIKDGALYHHERYDGTGYPFGKKGVESPFIGRLICVADAFDVMNSSRCYKEKLDKDVILSEIEKNKGTQFDPEIADVLLELIHDGTIFVE